MVTKMFIWTILISFFTAVMCQDKSKINTNKLPVQGNGDLQEVERPSSTQSHESMSEGNQVSWRKQQQLYLARFNMPFGDASSGLQWYINADSENNYNVKEVWKMNYTGAGIVVAVVDEGLNTTHPDLRRNYDRNASYDFVDGDKIPEPWPNETHIMTGHGSKCAGVIAAEAGNNKSCGVGLAYNARIGGIRLYNTEMAPDAIEAKALNFSRDYIDIYSNSWGPGDKGFEVRGPGNKTKTTLKEGAEKGRKGKGSIFVFASGNGGILSKDSCAYNGYVNSIYTIAISAVNRDGSVPAYGERCPGVMATAYSRDAFGDRNPVVTTGRNGQCEFYFGGSSAAAAMASGLIALTLEANQNLTWRDLQHIIVRSARFPDGQKPPDGRRNGAGLIVSNYMGFGLMDVLKMVNFAKKWKRVPEQRRCEIVSSFRRFKRNNTREPVEDEISLTLNSSWPAECGGDKNAINYLEHVQVKVNIEAWPRGDLHLTLHSPNKTVSRLTQHRPYDRFRGHSEKLTNWVILTLHHWGENPRGTWKLKAHLNSRRRDRKLVPFNWTLILYGTTSDPLENNGLVYNSTVGVVPKQRASNISGYIVQITTDRRYPQLGKGAKIQLFGVDGTTGKHPLIPSGNEHNSRSSSLLYYIRDHAVGNLTKVAIVQNITNRSTYWKLIEVSVRQEGNNPWISLPYNRVISTRVVFIKRACDKGFQRNHKDQCVQACEDKKRYSGSCPRWVSFGYCRHYHVDFMKRNCQRSCKFCKKRGKGCKDNGSHCSFMAKNNLCNVGDVAYTKKNCKKSCNFCEIAGGRGRDVDKCTVKNPCKNGASCTTTHGGYTCNCGSGFSGKNCDQDKHVDECAVNNPCKNGASCANTQGSYTCNCGSGFSGKNCDQDVDECTVKNPCKNGASCTNTHGGYTCNCGSGLSGKNCEQDVDECHANNPCKNGASCTNTHGGYTCNCGSGFSGKNCDQDVDECAVNNPCKNGASCANTQGSYTCECGSGFSGKNCEQGGQIPEFLPRPKNCKGVKRQGNNYVPNGENIIYPENTCSTSIRVYCHQDVNNADPKEYINVEKSGNYVVDWRGWTEFKKVRLDPERMLIIRDDTQFATFHGNKWYARKKHNYASVPWTCDAKRFSIDLSGTGLDLRRKLLDQSWVQSTTVIRRYKKYYVQCPRGQCIKCEPSDLFLSIDGCLTSK